MDKTKNKWKILYKEITKKDTRKYSTSTYVTALSNRTVKKESGAGGPQRKKMNIYLKLKKKQYQNNGTKNLFVVIMYSIEAFKMRLLSIARSFESPKRSNSTFKWLRKFLKDELMLNMSMKRYLRVFSKLKKCLLSSTFKLQLHKGFEVSRKPCLNLCSFKWLKRRRNLLIDLIKERSLLLKTSTDFKFCISGASCNHSDRKFWKKEYLKQSVLQLKKGLCFLRVS